MRLVYLMLRHSGAKLGEVLSLDERADLDPSQSTVAFRGTEDKEAPRRVVVPQTFLEEVERFAASPANRALRGELFHLDPGFVRRKLYEQARRAGLPVNRVSPTTLRHSRAVEMLRGGVPLPVVQVMLDHEHISARQASQNSVYTDWLVPLGLRHPPAATVRVALCLNPGRTMADPAT